MIYSFLVSAAILTTPLSASSSTGPVADADGMIAGFHPADSSYTLSGNIKGLGSGWVYLRHLGDRSDSVRADHDKFVFTGMAAEPEFCALEIRTPAGHKDFRVDFFLQSGQLQFQGNQDAPQDVVITGGTVQDEFKAYQEKFKLVVGGDKQEKQFVVQYAIDHPASYITVLKLFFLFAFNPDPTELGGLYNRLDPAIRSSYFGRQLKEVLDGVTRTAIGSQAPDFTQNDLSGKPVALSSLKGSYVLVDFWASWCGPCRAENPAVVKAYEKYHARGFTVIGVSLDDRKGDWANAVRKDRLNWMQVSDLKGGENSVAILYGVKGIPMNYLLDKDGKIVAKGLHGEELDKTLAQLLH